MAFQLTEKRESRGSSDNPPAETLVYAATGSNDAAFVRAISRTSIAQTVLTTMGVLHRQMLEVIPVGYQMFDVVVTYGRSERENGSWSWDFDTSGGTVHITTPIPQDGPPVSPHRNKYPAGAPDQELIGWDGENATGVDKVIPVLNINVTFNHPAGELTLARAKAIADVTGRVNSEPFLTFAPGEVLFLGARGQDGSTADASAVYQFAMTANQDGLTIGSILNVEKRGHDYLWVRHRKQEEGGKPIAEIEFVYVDQVYFETDLTSVLGFG